jgi:hypothetical protein
VRVVSLDTNEVIYDEIANFEHPLEASTEFKLLNTLEIDISAYDVKYDIFRVEVGDTLHPALHLYHPDVYLGRLKTSAPSVNVNVRNRTVKLEFDVLNFVSVDRDGICLVTHAVYGIHPDQPGVRLSATTAVQYPNGTSEHITLTVDHTYPSYNIISTVALTSLSTSHNVGTVFVDLIDDEFGDASHIERQLVDFSRATAMSTTTGVLSIAKVFLNMALFNTFDTDTSIGFVYSITSEDNSIKLTSPFNVHVYNSTFKSTVSNSASHLDLTITARTAPSLLSTSVPLILIGLNFENVDLNGPPVYVTHRLHSIDFTSSQSSVVVRLDDYETQSLVHMEYVASLDTTPAVQRLEPTLSLLNYTLYTPAAAARWYAHYVSDVGINFEIIGLGYVNDSVTLEYVDNTPGMTPLTFTIENADNLTTSSADEHVDISGLIGSELTAFMHKQVNDQMYTSPIVPIQVVRKANVSIVADSSLATQTSLHLNISFIDLNNFAFAITEVRCSVYSNTSSTTYDSSDDAIVVTDATVRGAPDAFSVQVNGLEPWNYRTLDIFQHVVVRLQFGSERYLTLDPVVTQSISGTEALYYDFSTGTPNEQITGLPALSIIPTDGGLLTFVEHPTITNELSLFLDRRDDSTNKIRVPNHGHAYMPRSNFSIQCRYYFVADNVGEYHDVRFKITCHLAEGTYFIVWLNGKSNTLFRQIWIQGVRVDSWSIQSELLWDTHTTGHKCLTVVLDTDHGELRVYNNGHHMLTSIAITPAILEGTPSDTSFPLEIQSREAVNDEPPGGQTYMESLRVVDRVLSGDELI